MELIWLEEAAGGRAQSLRVSNAQTEGPRGLKAGMTFEEASALFLSEGKPGVLYGQPGDTDYGEAVKMCIRASGLPSATSACLPM